MTCIRCHIQELERFAQNVLDMLEHYEKEGYCGSNNCYSQCPFDLKKKNETT
jgi:hypothetical protein